MEPLEKDIEEIINTLLQADAAAQGRLRENQQRRQEMADTMAQVREDIQKEYLDRAQQRVDTVRAQHQREFDELRQRQEEAFQAARSELERSYNAHRGEWVETLLHRCLG